MADKENTEEEPSIEEILDSIRQIISDDDDNEEDGNNGAEEENADDFASLDDDEDDVIELNDPIDEPKPKPEPIPEPKPETIPEPEPEDIPEPQSVEDIFGETDLDPEHEPNFDSIDIDMEDDSGENDNILTGVAESAAMDGFEKLVKKTAVEFNGITIEEIVRSELKPLLREWLDDNLPSMIERLVQEELERISKRVLGDN